MTQLLVPGVVAIDALLQQRNGNADHEDEQRAQPTHAPQQGAGGYEA